MAEEQAIPESLLREAEALAREWADIELFHDAIPALARALMAAKLRGRTEQREADARHKLRFSDDSKCPEALYAIGDARRIWVNEGDLVHMEMAGLATAIRSQTTT